MRFFAEPVTLIVRCSGLILIARTVFAVIDVAHTTAPDNAIRPSGRRSGQRRIACEDGQALDLVLELADIAGPRVPVQLRGAFGCEALRARPAMAGEEMLDQ